MNQVPAPLRQVAMSCLPLMAFTRSLGYCQGPTEHPAHKVVTVCLHTTCLTVFTLTGGEKKRNEILQMSVLDAELAILDEIDSGLDIDALKDVASAVNGLTKPETATIMVTHYKVTTHSQSRCQSLHAVCVSRLFRVQFTFSITSAITCMGVHTLVKHKDANVAPGCALLNRAVVYKKMTLAATFKARYASFCYVNSANAQVRP